MTVVSMNYLLEAGVQFGHQKRRWNPKMREYIFTTRDDIYIIDLQKTVKKLEEAYDALKEIAQNEGKVLFVGTKKQAQEAAEESAVRTNMYFVNERWLGGTLTNFKTIRSRIRRMEEIETMETDGTFDALPKKEVIKIRKEYDKLNKNLRGIREMKRIPQAMVIVDPRKEEIAIKEAHILGIPVFGIVDTNCDPDLVDYVIPGNDDAVRSVKLLIGALTNAIADAIATTQYNDTILQDNILQSTEYYVNSLHDIILGEIDDKRIEKLYEVKKILLEKNMEKYLHSRQYGYLIKNLLNYSDNQIDSVIARIRDYANNKIFCNNMHRIDKDLIDEYCCNSIQNEVFEYTMLLLIILTISICRSIRIK